MGKANMNHTVSSEAEAPKDLPVGKPLRLRWNFLWSFVGNSAFAVLQFIVMSMLGYFFGGETAQGYYREVDMLNLLNRIHVYVRFGRYRCLWGVS